MRTKLASVQARIGVLPATFHRAKALRFSRKGADLSARCMRGISRLWRRKMERKQRFMTKEMDTKPDKNTLELEYQTAQDSAQHHGNMSFLCYNMTYAGSFILLGFVVNNIKEIPLPLLISVCGLGIFFCLIAFLSDKKLSNIQVQKYNRCKEIERKLGMKQHSSLIIPGPNLTHLYLWMSICFVALWILIICSRLWLI